MILWILALIVLGCVGVVGYYQGALRAAFSFVGLLIASLLAVPLSGALKPILKIVGVDHPVVLAYLAPLLIFIIILAAVKAGALAVHKRVDTYYKYKVSDTERMLWERMNQRVGVCVGMANGFIYTVVITILLYPLCYFSFQLSTPESSSFTYKIANQLGQDIQSSKMTKAISGFVPAPEIYYDSVDILGDLYSNPLLESRLASYPAFLGLAEMDEFRNLAKDQKFHEQLWLKMNPRPKLGTFLEHERIKSLAENRQLWTNVFGLVKKDMKDLKTYMETGKSPKFDDEIMLGHWYYDFATSYRRAQKAKPSMTPIEKIKLRQTLGAFTNGVLTVFVDNKLQLKVPSTNANTAPLKLQGTWKAESTDKFAFTLKEQSKEMDIPASLEQGKLALRKENNVLYFEH